MLANSGIVAPIATILVQEEYADLDEEEPVEDIEEDDEEIEAPTVITLQKQKEEIVARREKLKDNEKFKQFLQERREIVVAERTRKGLPILKPLEVPSPIQNETPPAPAPRVEPEVVYKRVNPNHPSKPLAVVRRGPNRQLLGPNGVRRLPQGQLGRKVVYFKKGQGPMARMKQGGVVRNGQKMVVGPRRRLN